MSGSLRDGLHMHIQKRKSPHHLVQNQRRLLWFFSATVLRHRCVQQALKLAETVLRVSVNYFSVQVVDSKFVSAQRDAPLIQVRTFHDLSWVTVCVSTNHEINSGVRLIENENCPAASALGKNCRMNSSRVRNWCNSDEECNVCVSILLVSIFPS